ncbi:MULTISPECIES: hypothetical protein [unclassified Burkholderia]|uniref:hypothetical protein n=1 Tax=unclassified Burkholderia TaxID=2613784 RepID=UPI001420DCC3|nr:MULTISPECIES: hypothetical protein [unclassified Burkholderia]NIE57778.1 hypothetical protein [Burkholderia sp. Ap-955]NIF10777.1 hypothetical protein [Burkholderia sp. Ax-1735]NIG02499.1 hypothetical protein [Burkholderia sp. Tr-849]
MTVCLVSRLDRTVIQKKITKKVYLEALNSLKTLCKMYGTKAFYPTSKKSVKRSTAIFLSGNIQVDLLSTYGDYFVRYTIFPQRLSPKAFEEFIYKSEILGPAQYRTTLIKGYLREFEVAVDFVGKKWNEHLYYQPRSRPNSAGKWPPSYDGTSYVGSKKSPRQLCVYDKAKQLKAKGLPSKFSILLRIEERVNGKNLPVTYLSELNNLFSDVLVLCISKLKDSVQKDPLAWKVFVDQAICQGVPSALSNVPKKYKQTFRASLKSCIAPWWNPSKLMSGFPERAAKQLRLDICI